MTGNKSDIRKYVYNVIAEMPEEVFAVENAEIFAAVKKLPEYKNAKNVFLYCSMKNEPDTYELIKDALKSGKKVSVPLITAEGEMQAIVINDLSELKAGKYGIPAPSVYGEVMQKDDIDFILVPGAAFAADGTRLGRGGGYYDRFLKNTRAFTAGVVWSDLCFDSLPHEAHDIPVRCVVTGKKTARLS